MTDVAVWEGLVIYSGRIGVRFVPEIVTRRRCMPALIAVPGVDRVAESGITVPIRVLIGATRFVGR
jgi:hypothetical protein